MLAAETALLAAVLSVLVTSALNDVVQERHWVLGRSEPDVYTAEVVRRGVVASLDQRDGDRDLDA